MEFNIILQWARTWCRAYFTDDEFKKNKDRIDGRVFLNLSILEAHEIKNRKTTVGVNISKFK